MWPVKMWPEQMWPGQMWPEPCGSGPMWRELNVARSYMDWAICDMPYMNCALWPGLCAVQARCNSAFGPRAHSVPLQYTLGFSGSRNNGLLYRSQDHTCQDHTSYYTGRKGPSDMSQFRTLNAFSYQPYGRSKVATGSVEVVLITRSIYNVDND